MRFLPDTHTLIWWLEEHPILPASLKEKIASSKNEKFYSIISLWEIAIKRSIGKLDIAADFRAALEDQPFDLLPLRTSHVDIIEHLPLHHRDPFDRMLVAQAQCERLTFITKDRHLERYGITMLAIYSAYR